jgi:hypothetical protein
MFGAALPDVRDERWSLLESFLGVWFPGWTGRSGVAAAEIDLAAQRLGLPMPVALREFYQRYAAAHQVWSRQDPLLMPEEWLIRDGVLFLISENQGVVHWGIRVADLSLDDPPVVVSDPQDGPAWFTQSESLSSFFIAFAAQCAKWVDGLAASANGTGEQAAFEAVARRYSRMPFHDMHWPSHPTRFFGDDDLIVETNGADWIWASARTRAAFDELDALLRDTGFEWEFSEVRA